MRRYAITFLATAIAACHSLDSDELRVRHNRSNPLCDVLDSRYSVVLLWGTLSGVRKDEMKLTIALTGIAAFLALASNALAITLTKGTSVILAFDQSFSSRTAHKGDRVRLHVVNNVSVGKRIVLHQGAQVTLTITDVQKSGRFGKNGQIKMAIDPVRTSGASIPLQPRQKGNMVGGKKGTEAAGAAAGGALILGPIGLGAGYFFVGQSVTVKVGDKFETQVSEDVHIR